MNSNNQMPITVWGPLGWDWLHNLAICYEKYPSENDAYEIFNKIQNFIEKLPCAICKNHAISYITNNPINLTNNKGFQIWAWNFHNSVNINTNKPFFSKFEYNLKYKQNI